MAGWQPKKVEHITLTILDIMIEIKHPVPADHRALGPGWAPEKKQIGEKYLEEANGKTFEVLLTWRWFWRYSQQYLTKPKHKLHNSTVGLYICLENLMDNVDIDIDIDIDIAGEPNGQWWWPK